MNRINGQKCLAFGKYELWRLWGTAWPLLVMASVGYLTERSTELTAAGSATLGAAAGLAAKALQLYLTNNVGKKL